MHKLIQWGACERVAAVLLTFHGAACSSSDGGAAMAHVLASAAHAMRALLALDADAAIRYDDHMRHCMKE